MKRTIRRSGPLLLVLACWASAGCGGTEDTRPALWSYISAAIIQPSCATANCHSKLAQRSGVELAGIRSGYDSLMPIPMVTLANPQKRFVIAGKPEDSALIALIRGQGNRRMPPDFALPNDDIDLIAAWITDGALYDGPK
jgi:hypothetical protein